MMRDDNYQDIVTDSQTFALNLDKEKCNYIKFIEAKNFKNNIPDSTYFGKKGLMSIPFSRIYR